MTSPQCLALSCKETPGEREDKLLLLACELFLKEEVETLDSTHPMEEASNTSKLQCSKQRNPFNQEQILNVIHLATPREKLHHAGPSLNVSSFPENSIGQS